MSSCGDKDQMDIPKVGSSTSSVGSQMEIGSFRAQSYHSKDEIHIHDDANNLVFTYKGKRCFQIGIDAFLKKQFEFRKEYETFVVKGEPKSDKRDAADLILMRMPSGWVMSLIKCGKLTVSTPGQELPVVVADKTLCLLDEFVQRI